MNLLRCDNSNAVWGEYPYTQDTYAEVFGDEGFGCLKLSNGSAKKIMSTYLQIKQTQQNTDSD